MMDYHKELVCILDFGSQYTQLIARKVRELGVYCEIYPYNFEFEKIKALKPKGIILSGGPSSVYETRRTGMRRRHLLSRRPDTRHLLRRTVDRKAARAARCRDQRNASTVGPTFFSTGMMCSSTGWVTAK